MIDDKPEVVVFKERTYTLRRTVTGKEFIEMRQAQDSGKADVTSYLAKNLEIRLVMWDRDEQLTPENTLALPMDVYTVLYNVALRIEGDELEEANGFLADFWTSSSREGLSSKQDGSSDSPVDGSEPSEAEPSEPPNN